LSRPHPVRTPAGPAFTGGNGEQRDQPNTNLRNGLRISGVTDRNVLGGPLEECGIDPLTGFYRDGCCSTGDEDLGSHTVCTVVTAQFLEHQASIGNDLATPRPDNNFPGLKPGDRWCVVAVRWLHAHEDGAAAPVVLAATHEAALDVIPIETLRKFAVDVPDDVSDLL
jgi:uncharacterized protein (DUF2237 family)